MTVGNSKSMSSKSLLPPIIPIIPGVLGNFQVQFHQMEKYLLENSIFLLVLTSLSIHKSNCSTYFQWAGSLVGKSRFSLC